MSQNTDVSASKLASVKPVAKLGFLSLISVAVGLVVSQGVMVMMLHAAGIAGLSLILPLTLAWLLALSYACSFSELSLMIPRSGSLCSYTEVALGHFPAIIATFSGYIVVAMFALSAELLLLDLIIGKVFPHSSLPPLAVAAGVLLLFTLFNLMNIDIFARLQTALAVIMMIVLLVLGICAITSSQAETVQDVIAQGSLAPQGWGWGAVALVATTVWGFVGAEFVCPLIEETKRPQRDIPRAMMVGLTLIFITIMLYCLGALLVLPRSALTGDDLPHFLFATKVFGESGKLLLLAAAITATCSTLNSSLATIPRMLSGMSQNGQAFPCFNRHSRNGVPWLAVLFVAAITGLPLLLMNTDSISLLLLAAAICWLLAYIITHINVIVLRRRYPHLPRPFRTPFYPLPQVLGIVGMLYGIWNASPTPEMAGEVFTVAGGVLAVVAVIGALWVKLVMHKPLFAPEPIEKALNPSLKN
ncbi:APC family permease [Erwinia sp. S38]|uniref:APC family permease n=1 Tax=Erwinia sp. S38 TaxID=2769338 RepID=UPI00190A7992|nr:APC family permease [Erwinia sp. S38]MBK0001190.1 APC family permease [Erwinia sp. S38]